MRLKLGKGPILVLKGLNVTDTSCQGEIFSTVIATASCMCVSKKGTDRAELIVNLCIFGVSCLLFVFDRKLIY